MKIKIKNWAKYQQRTSGYRNCWWFSFSNKFLEDPEIWELTDSEKIAYIYILSQASQANKDEIHINFRHAEKSSDVKKSNLESAISKLEQFGVVARICTESGQDLDGICPVQDNTEQDNTEQDKTKLSDDKHRNPLFSIWNDTLHKFSMAKSMSPKRTKAAKARWKEKPDPQYWVNVVARMNKSSFLNGNNDRSWKADFDFFLKPDTHIKVMEGKYDTRTRNSVNQDLWDMLNENESEKDVN